MRSRDLTAFGKKIRSAIGVRTIEDDDELRPATLDGMVGQTAVKRELKLLCAAANTDGRVLDHVLLSGPAGLGKSSFAYGIAREVGAKRVTAVTAQTMTHVQLGKLLTEAKRGDLLFLDEIQTLSKRSADMLLTVLEEGMVDVETAAGPQRRPVEQFTLVGATTDTGSLSEPLRTRFGYVAELMYYSFDDIEGMIERSARALDMAVDHNAIELVADRSRQTPRTANALLKRLRDYATVTYPEAETIDGPITSEAFEFWGIDDLGLTARDREYMIQLYTRFRGGPVGEVQLGIALGMPDGTTVAKQIEPYLLRSGLVIRAPRGRELSPEGIEAVRLMIEDNE